jgi:hypothetical protein
MMNSVRSGPWRSSVSAWRPPAQAVRGRWRRGDRQEHAERAEQQRDRGDAERDFCAIGHRETAQQRPDEPAQIKGTIEPGQRVIAQRPLDAFDHERAHDGAIAFEQTGKEACREEQQIRFHDHRGGREQVAERRAHGRQQQRAAPAEAVRQRP